MLKYCDKFRATASKLFLDSRIKSHQSMKTLNFVFVRVFAVLNGAKLHPKRRRGDCSIPCLHFGNPGMPATQR